MSGCLARPGLPRLLPAGRHERLGDWSLAGVLRVRTVAIARTRGRPAASGDALRACGGAAWARARLGWRGVLRRDCLWTVSLGFGAGRGQQLDRVALSLHPGRARPGAEREEASRDPADPIVADERRLHVTAPTCATNTPGRGPSRDSRSRRSPPAPHPTLRRAPHPIRHARPHRNGTSPEVPAPFTAVSASPP